MHAASMSKLDGRWVVVLSILDPDGEGGTRMFDLGKLPMPWHEYMQTTPDQVPGLLQRLSYIIVTDGGPFADLFEAYGMGGDQGGAMYAERDDGQRWLGLHVPKDRLQSNPETDDRGLAGHVESQGDGTLDFVVVVYKSPIRFLNANFQKAIAVHFEGPLPADFEKECVSKAASSMIQSHGVKGRG